MKYYAVKKGRTPGIYTDWDETKRLVSGYPNAQYKSFKTKTEAEAYIAADGASSKSKPKVTTTTSGTAFNDIVVYTDGGSRNTGNVAGGHVNASDKAAWAYRIEIDGKTEAGSGGEFGATNNRMEIMALRQALKKLVELDAMTREITIIMDSTYVLNAIQKGWLAGWKKRGWKRAAGPLQNKQLWQDVDRLLPQFSHLTLEWTKGHATNEGNNFVDELLNQTMDDMPGKNEKTRAVEHHQVPKAKAVPTPKPQVTPAKPQSKSKPSEPTDHSDHSVESITESLKKLGF